jgi:uncharacterized protein YhdP
MASVQLRFRNGSLLAAAAIIISMMPVAHAQDRGSNQRGIFGAGQPSEVGIVRMEAKRLGIKNFRMQSRSSNGRLAIDGFSGNLGSGIISGTGLVDWSRPNDVQHLTIQVQGVEAAALMKAFNIQLDAQVHAIVNGTISVQWNGVRGTLPRETMQGSVRLDAGQGTISNADVLKMASAATGIAELQTFEFHSGTVQGTIRNGMMQVSAMSAAGPTKKADGSGSLDLRTEDVKVVFIVSLSPALATRSTRPQVRAVASMAGAGSKGGLVKIPLPIAMVGRIRNPEFVLSADTAPSQRGRASAGGN